MLESGVRATPDVSAVASLGEHEAAVMVWHYQDADVPEPDARVRLVVAGLPPSATRVLMRHYRIDQEHSNAFAAWQRMGSPQQPTAEQYRRLEASGQLESIDSPRWVNRAGGSVELIFPLPLQGVSLVRFDW
jgi:xylan 1,4-beta-xylosidase